MTDQQVEQAVKNCYESVRSSTADYIVTRVLEFIGSNQQFCKIDGESVTILYADKLFQFVTEVAKDYGVKVAD